MEHLNLILFISSATPLLMMMLICRKRTKRILLFLFLGIVVCLFCGEISGLFVNFTSFPMTFITINITPFVEEVCKAIPIIVYVFLRDHDDRSVLECAVSVGVGFAILENAFILINNLENLSIGLAIIRGFSSGTAHGLSTLIFGYGMIYVEKHRKLYCSGTIAMLGLAILFHSLYNILAQTNYYLVGYFLPILIFIPLIVLLRRKDMI